MNHPALGTAVVGLGAMGQVHRDFYERDDRTELRVVCDVDPARLPPQRGTTALAAVCDDPTVELVSVCSPHHDHAPIAVSLLEAGKAVILEKPAGVSRVDGLRILEAAGGTGRLVVKAYLRHSEPFAMIRRLVGDGAIGTVGLVVGTFSSRRHGAATPAWRLDRAASGGGCLLDSAIHLVDLVHWILGREAEVAAFEHRPPGFGVEVGGGMLLRFESGPVAVLGATQAGPAAAAPAYRLEVMGSEGRATVATDGSSLTLIVDDGAEQRVAATSHDWWHAANAAALASYVDDLLETGSFNEAPHDAVDNLVTVLAAYDAVERGVASTPEWLTP